MSKPSQQRAGLKARKSVLFCISQRSATRFVEAYRLLLLQFLQGLPWIFILMASRQLKSDRYFNANYTPAAYTVGASVFAVRRRTDCCIARVSIEIRQQHPLGRDLEWQRH